MAIILQEKTPTASLQKQISSSNNNDDDDSLEFLFKKALENSDVFERLSFPWKMSYGSLILFTRVLLCGFSFQYW